MVVALSAALCGGIGVSPAIAQPAPGAPFATFYGGQTFTSSEVTGSGTTVWSDQASWRLVWGTWNSDAGRNPSSSMSVHYTLVNTPKGGSSATVCNGNLAVVPGKNLVDQFLDGGNGVAPQPNGATTVIVVRPTTYLDGEGCVVNGYGEGAAVPDPLPGQLTATGTLKEIGNRLLGALPVFAQSAGTKVGLGGAILKWSANLNGTVVFGSPLVYAALGDSYSSGEFDASAGSEMCYRSNGAYPELYDPGKAVFLACSGATSSDILASQVPAIPPEAAIVSVTAGGDDIPIFNVLEDCIIYRIVDKVTDLSLGDPCFLHENIDLATVLPLVQTRLVEMYLAVHKQAPRARIFALGYPDPVPAAFRAGSCPGLENAVLVIAGHPVTVPAVDPADASFLHGLVEALNTRVRAAAHDSGVVQYVAPFSGHDACSSDPWFFPLSSGAPTALHPNAAGQKAMAAELSEAAGPPPQ